MPSKSLERAIKMEMARGAELLQSAVGETLSTVSIFSDSADEAIFLGQNISKLSPLIGNLIERRIPSLLSQHQSVRLPALLSRQQEKRILEWRRQDPEFPDAALFTAGKPVGAGFEVKAWFPLATEMTGRFRESQNLLAGKDIRLVVVAWMMSEIVFGTPEIVGVLVVDARSVAEKRDRHYHDPPNYICEEPQDTTTRTRNLQQTNVLGFKLQEQDPKRLLILRKMYSESPFKDAGSETSDGQVLSRELLAAATYRQDSNFAKIDRIDHPDIERFKADVSAKTFRGCPISEWSKHVRALTRIANGHLLPAQKRAIAQIRDLYEGRSL